jgi:hypothetical protein
MPQDELHQSLRDLNDEIEKTQTDDQEKQAALDEMKTHVERVLDDPDGPHHLDLPEPLESLSRAIEITVNSLSAMGI